MPMQLEERARKQAADSGSVDDFCPECRGLSKKRFPNYLLVIECPLTFPICALHSRRF